MRQRREQVPRTKPLDQINRLEYELSVGADIEAKLRRYIKREKKEGKHKTLATNQLCQVTVRLDRAEKELDSLKDKYLIDVIRARREGRYAPPVSRAKVKFFEIQEIAA